MQESDSCIIYCQVLQTPLLQNVFYNITTQQTALHTFLCDKVCEVIETLQAYFNSFLPRTVRYLSVL